MKTPKLETLTAFLHLSEGFSTAPVLEASAASDASLCLVTRTNVEEIFALDLSRCQCYKHSCERFTAILSVFFIVF